MKRTAICIELGTFSTFIALNYVSDSWIWSAPLFFRPSVIKPPTDSTPFPQTLAMASTPLVRSEAVRQPIALTSSDPEDITVQCPASHVNTEKDTKQRVTAIKSRQGLHTLVALPSGDPLQLSTFSPTTMQTGKAASTGKETSEVIKREVLSCSKSGLSGCFAFY